MTIHRLETNKLRNVAKFFSHLIYSDALSWNVMEVHARMHVRGRAGGCRRYYSVLGGRVPNSSVGV